MQIILPSIPLAFAELISIGSSATNTLPSGPQQTTDGCLTSGAPNTTSNFQSTAARDRFQNLHPPQTSSAHGPTINNPITINCKLHSNPLTEVVSALFTAAPNPSSLPTIKSAFASVTSNCARATSPSGA